MVLFFLSLWLTFFAQCGSIEVMIQRNEDGYGYFYYQRANENQINL